MEFAADPSDLLAAIGPPLTFLGVSAYWERAIQGGIILASGARARTLPGLEPDGKLIWTYKEAMVDWV